jgi:hypothetical protein
LTLDVAKSWIALHRSEPNSHEYEENYWAFSKVYDLCHSDPDKALEMILEIVQLDSSELILANIGSGPMEELLFEHGLSVIDRVEEMAINNPAFRKMLGAVWRNEIDDGVWTRLKRVAGRPF